MPLYFLTYDLRIERDYQRLYRELEVFEASQVLESTWCFRCSRTSAQKLITHFKSFIDGDDGLLVQRVSDWATHKANIRPKDLE